MPLEPFSVLAAQPEPALDELALALAAEFGQTDAQGALSELDRLGAELAPARGASPAAEVEALRELLGVRHDFAGAVDEYDHPDHSMLDLVIERRRGLPIVLSIVYVEVARRAGVALAGVGLPRHYVAGHFGADPPLLLDPFGRGAPLGAQPGLRPSGVHETVARMLNNLVGSYRRRGDLSRAIRAAEMRLELRLDEPSKALFEAELRSLRAHLN
ncbi:MAG: hypothetical protein AVDCRST_MAG45-487 [uncultured Solirubrobacterales bacterium]|uniref:Protein SirB1 N-terminal domain-containing protein n=1 Tax=uncultured Solirubrobacterales bacterium TaxID=768556 RepID=A0A6J4S0E0_9ACTN|nr:MAG: hypothetical protein AVDCRST_MAG45-487 [uncultured Solirubrobacterales bacterium]